MSWTNVLCVFPFGKQGWSQCLLADHCLSEKDHCWRAGGQLSQMDGISPTGQMKTDVLGGRATCLSSDFQGAAGWNLDLGNVLSGSLLFMLFMGITLFPVFINWFWFLEVYTELTEVQWDVCIQIVGVHFWNEKLFLFPLVLREGYAIGILGNSQVVK